MQPLSADLGRNLTYGLFELLGRSIVRGEYARGAFPTEGEIARRFGVSRSVSREAVKLLSAKGLLDGRPRNGTFVRSDSHWNLFDVDVLRWHVERAAPIGLLCEFTELRRAVEPEAAELAALRGDADEIAAIGRIVDRMRAGGGEPDDQAAAETAFHLSLLNASSNAFFRQFRGILAAALPASIRFLHRVSSGATDLAGHQAVYDAIAAQEPDAARRAMRRLLTDSIATLETLGQTN